MILIPLLDLHYLLFQKSCMCYIDPDTVAMSATSSVSEKLHVLSRSLYLNKVSNTYCFRKRCTCYLDPDTIAARSASSTVSEKLHVRS